MKEYLYDYIEQIDNLLNSNTKIKDNIIEKHLIKISFFQHERLIHLLVTLFYAVFFITFVALSFVNCLFTIITLILMIFLILYVLHYFKLENGVQYLYQQYEKMIEKR